MHSGIRSEVVVHASDCASRASSLQHEDPLQNSENGSVKRNFSEDYHTQLLSGETLNAVSYDPEKLKKRLKMLRAEKGELEKALVELDKDIKETERSFLDASCA